ncbi:MAG: zinc ribbon domain-containing protein [Fusobacteriaceae bacterium]
MKNKTCQSCGIPMSRDPGHGGTEKDGKTKSELYCSFCYKDGEFLAKNITAEEMKKSVYEILIDDKHKMPKFVAKFLTRNIPKLGRWQKQN